MVRVATLLEPSRGCLHDNAVFIQVDVEECEGVGAKFQSTRPCRSGTVSKKDFVILKSSFGQEGPSGETHKPSIKCLHFYSSENDYDFNSNNHASSAPAQNFRNGTQSTTGGDKRRKPFSS